MVHIVNHIRYKSLSPGVHAEAERESRGVAVYLLPGLTVAQRKAALRRLRQEGSRGCGPRLPLRQLAVALVADRLRTGATHTAAAIRQHPAGTLLPTLLAGGLLTVFMFASTTLRVAPAAEPGTSGDAGWSVPAGPPGGGPGGTPPGEGLAANAGAATAPLPATTAHGRWPAKSTPAGGGQAAGGDGSATSNGLPAPTVPAMREAQPSPPHSATAQPSPDPSAGPASGAGPAQSAPAPKPGTPPAPKPGTPPASKRGTPPASKRGIPPASKPGIPPAS